MVTSYSLNFSKENIMASQADIKKLLAGRALIDAYRSSIVENQERPPVSELTASIMAIGFSSLDEFFAYDRRLSMLEISRCYKGVNKFTGEEPPICDCCLNRKDPVKVPGCVRDAKTLDPVITKSACVSDRIATGKTWESRAITLEEDSIYQAQDAKYKELRLTKGLKFSIMDAIDWWDQPGHAPASCVAEVVEVNKPDFDFMWGLRK